MSLSISDIYGEVQKAVSARRAADEIANALRYGAARDAALASQGNFRQSDESAKAAAGVAALLCRRIRCSAAA